jgi:hypothetical protein
MATRMQQRRGTAQQWTDADPILAAGEIGFETDTNQFKIGDGVNAWSDLSYFKNLEDLGGSLDDYLLVTTRGAINGVASLDGSGKIPSSQIPALVGLDTEIASAVSAAVSDLVDGAPAALDTLNEISAVLGDPSNITGNIITQLGQLDDIANGLGTDVSNLESTVSGLQTDVSSLETTVASHGTAITGNTDALANQADDISTLSGSVTDHIADTMGVHGIANTADLATQSYAADVAETAQTNAETNAASTADTKISTHNSDTTDVHGIANTANLATKSYADTAVSDHSADTTNVHGISDTAALATKTYVDNAGSALQTNIDAKAPIANPTFTGTVAGITKSMVGLANVDNTSDANKPVSTATQTALDLKAPKAAPTFTGTLTAADVTISGNLTVSGTTTTVNTTNFTTADPVIYLGEGNNANLVDIGFVGSYNDGTYAHQGLVKDSSDGKWKLFKGVTDEPTTTVNFSQGSLDALKVGAFEATTVTPSSGIVFSDGTQVKAGVPSITTFATEISSSATLASGEQDKFVPLTGAVQITLPATGYSTGQSIDFYQASGTGASFASTNSVVGTPGLKFRTTNSVVTAMKTSSGWLVFGDLSA